MTNKTTDIVKSAQEYFLKSFSEDQKPVYKYLPEHVYEAEKWVKHIAGKHKEADLEIMLISVWLHDIGYCFHDNPDHAVSSEEKARKFLEAKSYSVSKTEAVCHCIRAHRCRDVQPQTIEAKILAVADSASHFTDFCYVAIASEGEKEKEYVLGKIERDYRDSGLFPELQKELKPLYEAWKSLILIYPNQK